MEELLHLIQTDPELWEIVEQLKSQDQEPEDFFLNVAAMLAVEFEELRRTDLNDKLAALFGGLPEPAFKMVPLLVHVALDISCLSRYQTKMLLKSDESWIRSV